MAAPTPNDALNYAKRFIGNIPLDDSTIKLRLLNDASKKLWMAAPWSWSLGSLEVVSLANDSQDVNLVGAYTDLLGLIRADLIAASGEPKSLGVSAILPSTTIVRGLPNKLQYIAGSPNKVRLLPVPTGYSTLPVTQVPKILATYKKKHAEIDATKAGQSYLTNFGVPDEWFWVFQEIVLLKAYQFTHDPRLGAVQVGPNGVQFSGQFASVEAAIAEMRRNEEQLFGNVGEVVNA